MDEMEKGDMIVPEEQENDGQDITEQEDSRRDEKVQGDEAPVSEEISAAEERGGLGFSSDEQIVARSIDGAPITPSPEPIEAEGDSGEDSTESDEQEEDQIVETLEGTTQQGSDTDIKSGPPFPSYIPWILLGILAGCIIGIAARGALAKMLEKRNRMKNTSKVLKVVTLQGIGARESQQDSLAATDPELYQEQGTLICLADGMGGLQNGSAISRTAVQAVISTFNTIEKSDPERMIAAMVQSATIAVNRLLSPNFGSGGTTLLIGYARGGKFYCASVGDSRICLVREGKLIHLNRPHVLEDELVLRYVNGEISYEDARNYQKKGGLTSYLGMGALKYLDFPLYHANILRGDRFVLMSDGVFNTLSDEELVDVFSKKPKSISSALNQEIEKKQQRFQDNYSAAVLIAE